MSFSIKIPALVVDEIVEYSINAFPKEFFAFLEGRVTMNSVIIQNLAYYPHDSNSNSATTIYHMGTHTTDFVGTIHSHPRGVNLPSRADLKTFNKSGLVHFIIQTPYRKENLKCYGLDGKELDFEVV